MGAKKNKPLIQDAKSNDELIGTWRSCQALAILKAQQSVIWLLGF